MIFIRNIVIAVHAYMMNNLYAMYLVLFQMLNGRSFSSIQRFNPMADIQMSFMAIFQFRVY